MKAARPVGKAAGGRQLKAVASRQCAASAALNACGWMDVRGKSFHTTRRRSPYASLSFAIVGTALPAAERAYWVGLLDDGLSVGAFTAMVADTSLNAANIDLTGLASSGLAYQ